MKSCVEQQIPFLQFLTWSWVSFCCYISAYITVTEPGVPYNGTVRASTAVGKGEPVSILVFSVEQGIYDIDHLPYLQSIVYNTIHNICEMYPFRNEYCIIIYF